MSEAAKYLPGTALAKAVDAYDAARMRFHKESYGNVIQPISDANKNSLAPLILEAIAAWEMATIGKTELRGWSP